MEKTTIAIDVELIKELKDFLEKIRRPKITIDFYLLERSANSEGGASVQIGESAIDLIKCQGIVADNLLEKLGDETGMF